MVAIPPPPSASVPPHRPSFKAPRSHTMLPSLSGGAIDLAVGGAATGGSIKRQGGANACFETALLRSDALYLGTTYGYSTVCAGQSLREKIGFVFVDFLIQKPQFRLDDVRDCESTH